MPYTDENDASLPESVQKLSDKDRRQWVAVFNSAFEKCTSEGGADCEASAFAQANGVVLQSRFILDLSSLPISEPPKKEVKPLGDYLFEPIWQAVQATDPQAWINDLYADEKIGQIFALISSQGKLYRANVTLAESGVLVSEWVEVQLDFPAVRQLRSQTRIIRQEDDSYRWFSISGTAALNKAGDIDSTKLFRSFIDQVTRTGEYPMRQFMHMGDQWCVGQCDWLAVDGYLLLSSGVYNDTELAALLVQSHLDEPDYWGESIGFLPTAPPEILGADQGLSVPVYNEGMIYEMSDVPEQYAAAWFTSTILTKEVTRMLQKREMEALIKLFSGDEDAAKEWLANNADKANRMIAENGMITRLDDQPPPAPPAVIQETPPAAQPPTIEFDESALDAIAERLARQVNLDEALAPIMEQLSALEGRITALEEGKKPEGEPEGAAPPEEMQEEIEQIKQQMAQLIDAEKKRSRQWYDDLPVVSSLRVTHRARQEQVDDQPQEPDGQEIAADVLSRIPVKY